LALLFSAVICSLQIVEKVEQVGQEKMVIYAINKHAAVDFIKGKNNILIADSLLLKDKDKMRFHITPLWDQLGLKHAQKKANASQDELLSEKGHYLLFKNMLVLNTNEKILDLKTLSYKPQIVLLNKVNLNRFSVLFKLFPEAKFICDGTISTYLYKRIKHKNEGLDIRSVMNEGAIIIEV
jgi:hypothetical protein